MPAAWAHAPRERRLARDEDGHARSRDPLGDQLAREAVYLRRLSAPAVAPVEGGQAAQTWVLEEACRQAFVGLAPREEGRRCSLALGPAVAVRRGPQSEEARPPRTGARGQAEGGPGERQPSGGPRAQAQEAAREQGLQRPQTVLALVWLSAVPPGAAIGRPGQRHSAKRRPFHRLRKTASPGAGKPRSRCKTTAVAARLCRRTGRSAHPRERAWRRKDRLALSS